MIGLANSGRDDHALIMSAEEAEKTYEEMITKLDQWKPEDRHMKRVTQEDLTFAASYIDRLISREWPWFERSCKYLCFYLLFQVTALAFRRLRSTDPVRIASYDPDTLLT